MAKNDVEILRACISTVTAVGGNTNVMTLKYYDAKKLADTYSGRILRDELFKDGFFLEVLFANEIMKTQWENSIGVK